MAISVSIIWSAFEALAAGHLIHGIFLLNMQLVTWEGIFKGGNFFFCKYSSMYQSTCQYVSVSLCCVRRRSDILCTRYIIRCKLHLVKKYLTCKCPIFSFFLLLFFLCGVLFQINIVD